MFDPIRLNAAPSLTEFTEETAIASFVSKSTSVLGCFTEMADRKVFSELAEKFKGLFYFGMVSKGLSPSLCKRQIVRITDVSGFQEEMDWKGAMSNFKSILLARYLPMVMDYSPIDGALLHHLSELPMGVFFYSHPHDRKALEDRISPILSKYRHKVVFIFAKWMESEPLAREFKIQEPTSCALPALSVGFAQKKKYYPFPKCGLDVLTSEAIDHFLERIFKDKIEPYSRSEERLHDDEGNAYHDDRHGSCEKDGSCISALNRITHDTFWNKALEVTKKTPVLVQLYADWCIECQSFEKIFKSVAAKLDKRAKLVSLNVDFNDIPQCSGIKGYERLPAIYLYPQALMDSSCKASCSNCAAFVPIKYQGPLEYESIMDFFEKNKKCTVAASPSLPMAKNDRSEDALVHEEA